MKFSNTKDPVNNYAKYSSMALQMGVIIFLGVFGGMKLDELIKWKWPVFTVVFSFLSVILAIYYVIKDFLKK